MGDDSRAAIVRWLDAFTVGRADRMAEMYAEDGVMHLAGTNPISGTYRGRAAIEAALRRMFQLLAGTSNLRAEPPEAILSDDRHEMILFRATAERNGNALDAVFVFAAELAPDGRLRELWFMADNQAAYDRFWS